MKILAFEPFAERKGHFGVYTAHISQELALLGHHVTVVTTRLNASRFIPSPPKFQLIEINKEAATESSGRSNILKSAYRGVSLILDNARVLIKLFHIYRKSRFDLVHFFDYEPVSTVFLLSVFSIIFRTRIAPLYVVVHAPDPSYQGHGNPLYHLYSKLSRPMLRMLLECHADIITAHGTWPAGELERLLGLNPTDDKIRLAPYGTVIQQNLPSRKEARKALKIEYDGPLILFFGMLRKDKGVELLIEAMGKVEQECMLLLAGMPFDWNADGIHQMVRAQHAEDRIIPVLEYIPEEEIPNYFAAADALILPYKEHYMGAAGPLKTALGFGKPVIASKVRDLAQLMSMDRIGIATVPGNAESLRGGIEEFLSLPSSQRDEMARNSRRLAGSCSWAVVAKRFSEIYESFARKKDEGSTRFS